MKSPSIPSDEHVRPKDSMSKVRPWVRSLHLFKIPGVGFLGWFLLGFFSPPSSSSNY